MPTSTLCASSMRYDNAICQDLEKIGASQRSVLKANAETSLRALGPRLLLERHLTAVWSPRTTSRSEKDMVASAYGKISSIA